MASSEQSMSLYPFKALALIGAVSLFCSGCASLVSSVTRGFAEDLSAAILNNEDTRMVRDGAPSYLILVDSLVSRSPNNVYLLQQSATLHAAYAAAFVDDENRAKLLYRKAMQQAKQAACKGLKDGCELDQRPYQEYAQWVEQQSVKNAPLLFTLATSWAGWIQANTDDFVAIAQLSKAKLLMERVAQLDPDYQDGSAFLYLGAFESILPPAMGGKPDLARDYFEQALVRSEGRNLLAKVTYAQQYARLVFDRELHDRLLNEVIEAPVQVPDLTLMNSVAKEQAQQLLDSADDFF